MLGPGVVADRSHESRCARKADDCRRCVEPSPASLPTVTTLLPEIGSSVHLGSNVIVRDEFDSLSSSSYEFRISVGSRNVDVDDDLNAKSNEWSRIISWLVQSPSRRYARWISIFLTSSRLYTCSCFACCSNCQNSPEFRLPMDLVLLPEPNLDRL